MARLYSALAFTLFASAPAIALAQAAPGHWSAKWAGPLLLGGALVLLVIGFGLAFRGWNALGAFLGMLVLTAGGLLTVYAMQGAVLGKLWQGPSMLVGFLCLSIAGQWAFRRLNRVDADE